MESFADRPMFVRTLKSGGFARTNRSFESAAGFTAEALAKKSFMEWLHPDDEESARRVVEGEVDAAVVRHKASAGGYFKMQLRASEHGDDCFVLAQCAESVKPSGSDGDQCDEYGISSTLHRIATIVEEQNPGRRCSILLVENDRFVQGVGPSLPEAYNNAFDGYSIGPAVGSCGTAMYWSVPVIVEDIQHDPLWAGIAEIAKQAGVAACWSHPFTSHTGTVLGTLAVYSEVPSAPTEEQLRSLKLAAQLTGLAVERGRAEEQLRSANAVKDRFMANLSHEIRTPLNALVGTCESIAGSATGSQREDVAALRESSDQLLKLFTSALDMTAVKDRYGVRSPSDLHALMSSAREAAIGDSMRKGLAFVSSEVATLPQWVDVDAWGLGRVVGLLLDNAVKFTDQGLIKLTMEHSDDVLHVCVSDNGCGVDLDRVAELRRPFVQGDSSTTKEHDGFGLGLALVDMCLESMGGDLEFRPNGSQGTVAELKIPMPVVDAPEESVTPPDHPAVDEPGDGPLPPVLVVEDNALNRRVIERLVTKAGYVCDFRSNGAEAVEAFSETRYSCILMDCQMPVMDGYEATRRIRLMERKGGGRIPIIAVTANALPDDRERCIKAGMDDYLEKPIRVFDLVGMLQEYLGEPGAAA